MQRLAEGDADTDCEFWVITPVGLRQLGMNCLARSHRIEAVFEHRPKRVARPPKDVSAIRFNGSADCVVVNQEAAAGRLGIGGPEFGGPDNVGKHESGGVG